MTTAVNHGTRSGYVGGCHCPPCKQAHLTYMREWRARAVPPPAGDSRHGTLNCYRNYGCRCKPCAKANADMCRSWRGLKKKGPRR